MRSLLSDIIWIGDDKAAEKAELQFWIDGLSSLVQTYKQESQQQQLKEEQQGLKPLRGWLRKMGEGTLRGWKKRYVKQDAGKLYYYLSDADKDALGYIDLAKVLKIVHVSDVQFELIASASSEKGIDLLMRISSYDQALRGLGYKFDPRSSDEFPQNTGHTTVRYQFQIIPGNKGNQN